MRSALGRPVVRRSVANLADQSISLISNFGLIVVLARVTTGEEFGWYSALIVAHRLLIMLNRGATTDAVNISCRGERSRVDRHRAAVLRSSLLSGSALAVPGVIAALIVLDGHPVQSGALCFALGLPGFLVQDADRQLAFAARSPRGALRNDLIWTGTFCVALAVVFAAGVESPNSVFACWVAGATVAAIVALARPGPLGAAAVPVPAVLRRYTLGEAFLDRMGIQGSTLLVALGVGWADLGSLVAARTLLSPTNFVLFIVVSVGTAEVGALERTGRVRAARGAVVAGAAVLIAVPLLIAGVLHATPVGRWLIGPKWEEASRLVVPTAVFVGAIGLQQAMAVGLRSQQRVRPSLAARAASTVLLVTIPPVVAVRVGIEGAAWAFAFSAVLAALIWMTTYGRRAKSAE